MKKILFFPIYLLPCWALAQKGLDEMIATEKSFAAYAVANNTRDAFLKFMDTAAIMFDKGNPVNGYQLWLHKKPSTGILNWGPRFAEVSASGDFGYTCGSWTYQPTSLQDSILASGYFITVWQQIKGVGWKFIFDGGTEQAPQLADWKVIKQKIIKEKGNRKYLRKAEIDFTQLAANNAPAAYRKYLSRQSVVCREVFAATASVKEQTILLSALPSQIIYQQLGFGIAPTNDLAYTYGNTVVENKKEFYVHIWRHEKQGWKLALCMLRY